MPQNQKPKVVQRAAPGGARNEVLASRVKDLVGHPISATNMSPPIRSDEIYPGKISRAPGNKSGKVNARYPMRDVTYYQIARSDLRSIGVAQAAATLCAAIGTYALTSYLDISRDVALAGTNVPPWLTTVQSLAFGGWIIFWGIAVIAFIWQGLEIRRIKIEHGEPTLWQKCKTIFQRNSTHS